LLGKWELLNIIILTSNWALSREAISLWSIRYFVLMWSALGPRQLPSVFSLAIVLGPLNCATMWTRSFECWQFQSRRGFSLVQNVA
jgi:hypothetical protein